MKIFICFSLLLVFSRNFVAQVDYPTQPEKGYYECVELSKGIVIGWSKDSVMYGCYKN